MALPQPIRKMCPTCGKPMAMPDDVAEVHLHDVLRSRVIESPQVGRRRPAIASDRVHALQVGTATPGLRRKVGWLNLKAIRMQSGGPEARPGARDIRIMWIMEYIPKSQSKYRNMPDSHSPQTLCNGCTCEGSR